ncbi:glycosyltransferase family 9 protein [Desulfuromonas sp. KJ2020]|uniref:glycosyltransferase family 9 protein n=1 Tax=Desulfuromonas sp. KJ2020 TaxID=2919173 RepID=UPI0020A74A92|nr:glycosyltransferase family 9 protein [Desulfuromonas sp. KJ2020]MCP3177564.1 glycosyltransferase family 9 protein [Desulfuromonas sp. KJ2020]
MSLSLPLSAPPKSLCILRLSALGDVTHVLPTLRTLQQHWPQCHITWVIGKTEASLVNDIPGVEFIIFDKSQGLKAYRELHKKLKNRRFDVLLHMQAALRASLASLLISADIRLGFDRARATNGQWLFTNARIAPLKRQHVLDGFLEFAKALGLEPGTLCWDIPIPPEARESADRMLPDEPFLVINPCSSVRARNWRNWSVESYAAVINHAFETHGLHTVLTGGPAVNEKAYAEAIVTACRHTPVNLVGRTTLKQMLAVLDKAAVVIAPDTGPAHMANALGKKVIGLYATSNPERTGPYCHRELTVNRYPEAIKAEYGKGVEELRWGKRVRNPEAMMRISKEEVQHRLDEAI